MSVLRTTLVLPEIFAVLALLLGGCIRDKTRESGTAEYVDKNRALIQENSLLNQERIRLKQENRDLRSELSLYKPGKLPLYEEEDLLSGGLVLARIFSVETGSCFSINGDKSCFFRLLPEEEGGGYVAFKANRRFRSSPGSVIFDRYGNELEILTTSSAAQLRQWGRENPHGSLRLGAY